MKDKDKGKSGELPPAKAVSLKGLLDYVPGSIVSRTLAKNKRSSITLFAFDQGQALSEHSAPFDAFVSVLDGKCEVVIGGKPIRVAEGQTVVMPANVPHAVNATNQFKMLLIMLRG